jgi:hypothetical protein
MWLHIISGIDYQNTLKIMEWYVKEMAGCSFQNNLK